LPVKPAALLFRLAGDGLLGRGVPTTGFGRFGAGVDGDREGDPDGFWQWLSGPVLSVRGGVDDVSCCPVSL